MSHCKQIYQHLMTGKEINPMQALNLFGCFALSQRIGDLKRIHGVPVQTRLYHAPNGKKWSIYWLEPYYINQVKAGMIETFCCVSEFSEKPNYGVNHHSSSANHHDFRDGSIIN